MGKQKKMVANKPVSDKPGDKFGDVFATKAKAGAFNQVSANTSGGKKHKK